MERERERERRGKADGACVRREMSFPARGNLRHVAIGGSKLAREYGRCSCCANDEGRERGREREDGAARVERGRGKCAAGERWPRDGQARRGFHRGREGSGRGAGRGGAGGIRGTYRRPV